MKCRQFGSNVAVVHFFFQKCTMLHLIRGWRHFILDHRILCRPKTTFGPRVGSIVALTQCCLCDIGPGDAFPMVSSDELTGQRTHSVECRRGGGVAKSCGVGVIECASALSVCVCAVCVHTWRLISLIRIFCLNRIITQFWIPWFENMEIRAYSLHEP